MSTRLWLVRHGRTAWHDPVRYAGDSDIDLDPVGREQAAALAGWAAGQQLTSLVCSDLRRARATAAPVARSTGLTPVVDPRLREPHFGIAEGRTFADVAEDAPDAAEAFRRDPAAHPWPGAEPAASVARRAVEALRAAALTDPGGNVVVVAHSTLIRLAICELLGIPLGSYRQALPRLDPTTTTELMVREDGSVGLVTYNAG